MPSLNQLLALSIIALLSNTALGVPIDYTLTLPTIT